jgi:hypothetical protein
MKKTQRVLQREIPSMTLIIMARVVMEARVGMVRRSSVMVMRLIIVINFLC